MPTLEIILRFRDGSTRQAYITSADDVGNIKRHDREFAPTGKTDDQRREFYDEVVKD